MRLKKSAAGSKNKSTQPITKSKPVVKSKASSSKSKKLNTRVAKPTKAHVKKSYPKPIDLKKVNALSADLIDMGIQPYRVERNEEYMNEAQKEHFRKILNIWRQQLMEEVDRTMHHMQDEANNYPDPSDRATQEEEFSLELRTRDRERKLIKKIEKTLQLIDHDDYGYCEACGIEIGVRRLEARPTATLCIDCKTLEEIREKQGNLSSSSIMDFE